MAYFQINKMAFKDFQDKEVFILKPIQIKTTVITQNIESIIPKIELMIDDRYNMRDEIKLTPGYKLSLSIDDYYENNIVLDFVVNEVIETPIGDDGGAIWIKVSANLKNNLHLAHDRLYSSYNGITPSNLIKQLVPSAIISPTVDIGPMACPGWSTNKFIKHIASRAKTKKGDHGLLWFETLSGIYLKSINDIIRTKDRMKMETGFNKTAENNLIDFREISNYKLLSSLVSSRGFNSKTIHFDFKTKKFVEEMVDVSGEKLTEGVELFDPNINKLYSTKSRVHLSYDPNVNNKETSDAILSRYTKRYQMLINGNFKVEPGQPIEVQIPNKTKIGELSDTHNGIYIITKVAHHMTGDDFMTKLEIARNSKFA